MFLKSLTIHGFKSFATKQVLDLEPGISVVVGPNGSGKSNIVDAVAWVLGAQGARALRGGEMKDVIFGGTPNRPALGRAQVSLVIDNSDRYLPIDFTEVTISRTLYRSGDSEYAINGAACRLLDITELLSDSGVGRSRHVIVSQGHLDDVLRSKPEDRRTMIEDAAGILKFRRRRERSQRRLDDTEKDLTRLQDLLREVRRQIKPLERQAAAAQRHGSLVAVLDGVRLRQASEEVAALSDDLSQSEMAQADLVSRRRQLKSALDDLEAEIAEREAALVDDAGDGLRRGASSAETLLERVKGRQRLVVEKLRGIRASMDAAADASVAETLVADRASSLARLDELAVLINDLEPERQRVIEAREQLSELDRQLDAMPGRANQERLTRELAQVDGALRSHTNDADRLGQERTRLESRISEHAQQLADADVARLLRTDALATAKEAVVQAQERLERSVARSESSDAEFVVTEGAADAARSELSKATAAFNSIQTQFDMARQAAGVERFADIPGVVGTLAELVEVRESATTAVASVLSDLVKAIVVQDVSVAAEVRERAHAHGEPALMVIRSLCVSVPEIEVGTDSLANMIRCSDPVLHRWLQQRLAEISVTRNDSLGGEPGGGGAGAGVGFWVDANGDQFDGAVWRLGQTGAATVSRSRLDDAAKALADAQSRAEELSAAAKMARVERDEMRNAHQQAENERRGAQRNLDQAERALATFDDAQAGHARVLQEARAGVAELDDRERALAANRASLMAQREQLTPQIRDADAQAAQRRNLRSARDKHAHRCSESARALELSETQLNAERGQLQTRVAELDRRLERHASERAEAQIRRQHLDDQIIAYEGVAVRLGAVEIRVAAIATRLAAQLQDVLASGREVTRQLAELRRQRSGLVKTLGDLSAGESERIERRATLKTRLDTLLEAVLREYGLNPEALADVPCPELPSGATLDQYRRELERELRSLGVINPLAVEEFAELRERSEFLEGQLDDVKKARRELNGIIRSVDSEIGQKFSDAFEDVSCHFSDLFAKLFPGGEGRLSLTEPDDPLNTGVEIFVQIAGKNVRRLSLLSGGERSLTSMAFLFAIFRARPSPFYILDEVEAALDDVNLHRFLALLEEFRKEAQLLVVTHQKRTMDVAECLHGVSQRPSEGSVVVSEKIGGSAERERASGRSLRDRSDDVASHLSEPQATPAEIGTHG
ncbi:MAG: chromosome segregation protein SMC [Actinobacteria bacterium]|nr:chromosome segregation protein SMC [Actinomycetota bacterium]